MYKMRKTSRFMAALDDKSKETTKLSFYMNSSLLFSGVDIFLYAQDKYILTSMAILCSICLWHAIIAAFLSSYDPVRLRTIDRWGLGVCALAYGCFHVCFFMYIFLLVSQSFALSLTFEIVSLYINSMRDATKATCI